MKLAIKIVRNEQGTYTAICPSLPGCVTKGATREEAHEKLHVAIQGYLGAVLNAPDRTDELVEA